MRGRTRRHPRSGVAAWVLVTHWCAGMVWVVAFNVALGQPASDLLSALPFIPLLAPFRPMQVLQACGLFGFAFN